MQKVILRLGMYIGLMLILVFVGIFTWANWTPLTAGEKAEPVRFVVLDAKGFKDSTECIALQNHIKTLNGVNICMYVPKMQTVVTSFKVLETDLTAITSSVKEKFNREIGLKKFKDNGRKCPVMGTLTTMSRIRKTLNIRG